MLISSASFEAVAWQRNSVLKPRLTAIFQEIIDHHKDEPFVRKRFYEISDAVFVETGIKIEGELVDKSWFFGPYEISVHTPNMTTYSPVNTKAVERMRKLDVDNMSIYDTIEGRVDYSTGKVSGFFSLLVNKFSFSRKTFEGEIPAAELAAAFLHEVAHAWINCAYMGETLATNFVIAEMLGQYNTNADVKKKFLIGKAALKLSGSDKQMTEDTDVDQLTAFVLEGQVLRMQKGAGTRWYDHRLTETLADQFAIRFGAGADLVRALARFERSRHIWADAGYEPKWVGAGFNFMNIALLPFNVAEKTGALVAATMLEMLSKIATSFSFSFFMSGFLSEVSKKISGNAQAPLAERVQTIRRDIISELKNRDLPDDTRRIVLADLAAIDEMVKETHGFTDVYSRLTKWIVNKALGRSKEMAHHHLVDDLANNRLYEFSAQFKR